MKKLTIKNIEEIAKKYPYFLIRHERGFLTAVNSKIISIAKRRANKTSKSKTNYVSFTPCNINEYINHKTQNNLLGIEKTT